MCRALLWSREGRLQACECPKLSAALEAAAEAAAQRGDAEGARQLAVTQRELDVYRKQRAGAAGTAPPAPVAAPGASTGPGPS